MFIYEDCLLGHIVPVICHDLDNWGSFVNVLLLLAFIQVNKKYCEQVTIWRWVEKKYKALKKYWISWSMNMSVCHNHWWFMNTKHISLQELSSPMVSLEDEKIHFNASSSHQTNRYRCILMLLCISTCRCTLCGWFVCPWWRCVDQWKATGEKCRSWSFFSQAGSRSPMWCSHVHFHSLQVS